LCILELSRLTRVEKAAKNTTIVVIYKVLVYIQISQPTDEIFVYTQTPCILQL